MVIVNWQQTLSLCFACTLSSSSLSLQSGTFNILGHQILAATHQYQTTPVFSVKCSQFRGREPFAVLLHQIVVVAKYGLWPQTQQLQKWQRESKVADSENEVLINEVVRQIRTTNCRSSISLEEGKTSLAMHCSLTRICSAYCRGFYAMEVDKC